MNKKHGVEDFRWLIREVIREIVGEHGRLAGGPLLRRGNAEFGNADRILVSSSEAARMLGISERTLWELKRRGELPHIAIGSGTKKESIRYAVTDLYALVAKRKVQSTRSANIPDADGSKVQAD